MSNNNLKNIVVLNNLPSNLIDEAIIILKSKRMARKLELVEKNTAIRYKKNKESDDYIIKEAENIISNYISKIEKKHAILKNDVNIETKYKKIKVYSIVISIVLIFCIIKSFF